jgi:hypothetical protein
MPHIDSRPTRLVGAVLTLLLAGLLLTACGSSGKGSATTTATTASGATARNPGARFTQLRECLKKQGVTLPTRKAGGGTPPTSSENGAGGPGSGPQLPGGINRTKLQEALKKCGGGAGFGGGRIPGGRFNDKQARAALTKYAACLRENGVDVPKPNTSGKGPVFDTKGIDTSSAAFKKAQSKCKSLLPNFFRGRPGGASGGPPPGGATPYGAPPGASEGPQG